MKKIVLVPIFLIIISACRQGPETSVSSGYAMEGKEWLLGLWKIPDQPYFEHWKKESDTSFAAISYRVLEGDTHVLEHIRLFYENEKLVYQPTLQRDSGQVAINFWHQDTGRDTLVFENPAHDFPNLIYYEHAGQDSLHIFIQGTLPDSSTSRQYFSMKRYLNG